jgi:2-polyprenyl-6-methoxyphenol hydroxylase-like FAD-dependent oxidoreductase
MASTPVLIAGAGPTGLVLALGLARRGVACRIVDDGPGPGDHSRAMVVHARTLESYRQFGFADDLVAEGVPLDAIHLRRGDAAGHGHELLTVSFKEVGEGLSPYPFALAYPQDDHERFLVNRLRAAGVEVEWNTSLTGFTQDADLVHVSLARTDGAAETVEAGWLCGADGARSLVRQTLGVGFPGGTYDQLFYVADVAIEGGFNRDLHVNLGEHILALMLPVRSRGMQRLIGLVPPELSGRTDLSYDELRPHVEPLLGVHVTEVNWFATYRVHHRVAERFRVGRAFISGDAGHIHSPAGGQGMNTGIGDAMNLAWKLAGVLRGRVDAAVLDSYEPERIAFARSLVGTTDRAFTGLIREGAAGELVRRVLAPLVLGIGSRTEAGRHAFFRTVSQTRIHYHDSALSEGEAGDVHGGDRLPWTGARGADNFAPLRSLDWQVHVYGEPGAGVAEAAAALGVPVRTFVWDDGARDAGLERGAVYLVRPDGYVALAATQDAPARLSAYARRIGLRPGEAPSGFSSAGATAGVGS